MDMFLTSIIVLIIIGWITLLAIAISIIISIVINLRKLKIENFSSNANADIDEKTFLLLDKIIAECFTEYVVLNLEYKDIEHVDSKLEKQITTDVSHLVVERLSPTLMTKISLVYNIDNFPKLLAEKVYLHTLNYTIEKNSLS